LEGKLKLASKTGSPTLTTNNSVFCPQILIPDFYESHRERRLFPYKFLSVDFCNGEMLCFLCDRDYIFKYYLEEFWLQVVKKNILKSNLLNICTK
jgi:hypothetical protein